MSLTAYALQGDVSLSREAQGTSQGGSRLGCQGPLQVTHTRANL